MENLNFKSEDFEKYVKSLLGKNETEALNQDDLDSVEELSYNPFYLGVQKQNFNFIDLLKFKNLKNLLIRNIDFENRDIQVINKLENLKFLQVNNCDFKKVTKKINKNLDFLAVVNSQKFSFKMISPKAEISCVKIINVPNFKLKGLSNINEIDKLYLQDINELNLYPLNKRNDITYLNLDGSKLKNGKELIKLRNKMKIDYRIMNMYM